MEADNWKHLQREFRSFERTVLIPKVLLAFRSEMLDEMVVFLANKVEQRGCWTVHAITLFFLLIPENLTRETTRALMSFIYSIVGMAERTSGSKSDRKESEIGRDRNKQWRF